MSNTWKLEQARANLSELVERAIRGETQLITKHGQAAVYVIAAKHAPSPDNPSLWDIFSQAPRIEEDWLERDTSSARDIDL
jgi:prevent-host-death family protein